MLIIRDGDRRRCALLVGFECDRCGCMFVAGPHEHRQEGDRCVARCPCCWTECAETVRERSANNG